jgi:hypothetical protein
LAKPVQKGMMAAAKENFGRLDILLTMRVYSSGDAAQDDGR